ncbi:hypothetical protein M595_2914 [Lyngbya aestuarii BL J]|uniref:Uncharacterized protein n=1 Tax=Lyngbya aestuarii BL J TaxID=1348334 RepID=U7QL42_9CYAN|nr:hypothetical protein M595_2914 [Lyngbya aestuarii BL J]
MSQEITKEFLLYQWRSTLCYYQSLREKLDLLEFDREKAIAFLRFLILRV